MLKVLLSADAADRYASQIQNVLEGVEHQLLLPEQLSPGAAIDIAFISRDVTGRSTKYVPAPASAHFYELLLHSACLQWVHVHSAGADRPVLVELHRRGVKLSTSSGANAGPVAHSVLAAVLSLARRFPQYRVAQQAHHWGSMFDAELPRDLRQQTAMVVGWGPIGQEIGRLLRAVGMRCIAVRRSAQACSDEGLSVVAFSDMSAHLGEVDWLVLACPLSDTTRGLVDQAAIERLRDGAHLVNVARGEVVVQDDVIRALQTGRLAGAYLDVAVPEPLPADSPLWDMPNVIITPHSAGYCDTNADHVAGMFLDNLARWRKGEALDKLVH